MKIATWNVNSLRVRLDHVRDWLTKAAPEILGLQETKLTDDKFPVAEFEEAGYRSVFSGQPTYNGVALLSREPATEIVTEAEEPASAPEMPPAPQVAALAPPSAPRPPSRPARAAR